MQNQNLQYDRQAVTLALELKRSLPRYLQDDFKLSSPDFVDQVRDLHGSTSRSFVKELAEKFLEHVGSPLNEPKQGFFGLLGNSQKETASRASKKLYRGRAVD